MDAIVNDCFMNFRELGIRKNEYDALCQVLDAMQNGKVIEDHIRNRGYEIKIRFNMKHWTRTKNISNQNNFLSGCCIGGLGELMCAIKFSSHVKPTKQGNALYGLFYPSCVEHSEYGNITVKQAANALRNYLTMGNALWQTILK